jgi:hypothetical protein
MRYLFDSREIPSIAAPVFHSQKAHKNVIINLQPDAKTVAHVMASVRSRMANTIVIALKAGQDRTVPFH